MLSIKFRQALLVSAMTAALAACGGSSSDKAPEPIIPDNPTPDNPSPDNPDQLPSPVVTAGDNQLVIFYNRPDKSYQDWILHTWNNDACSAYADADTDWSTGRAQTGIDPNYGAYWLLDLTGSDASCANFIVHKGDDKDLGGVDHQASLSGDRMVWTLSQISEIFNTATLYPKGVLIADTAAHWLDPQNLMWNVGSSNVSKVRVYSSNKDDLMFDGENGIAGDNYVEFALNSGTNPAEGLNMPRYAQLQSFVASNSDVEKIKTMVTGKLLAIAYDSAGELVSATLVQKPRLLDALYGASAADAKLGLVYDSGKIVANLWAPTAQQVALKIYDSAKALVSTNIMTKDSATGIWSFAAPSSVDRQFYRFELVQYHQHEDKIETIEVTDPYSVSLATNGNYSQFVNLADPDLKPQAWDSHNIPTIENPEDAVIYEGHIRDFSIRDQSTSVENRGKYLAFTEQDSVPVNHLKSMVGAGLTHFQMLPANDIASIDENNESSINLDSMVSQLCAKNSTAPVCGVEDASASLLSVLESYDPSTTKAQALVDSFRGLDSFNWGYDPKHFNAPDGSYASNTDGVARIIEMRAMNQSLHEMGLRVVLDVVYNHTNSSGLWDNSVLDKVVPGYYHRRNLVSGNVETSTCCQDTAPEHLMMQKLMVDSLVQWTDAYKFDGFRFDIMSNNSVASILAAREAVQAIDPDNYFYGEGWTRDDRGYEQAKQENMAGTQVGTFNDRPRDVIRQAALFKTDGSLQDQDVIRLGLAGTLADYQLQVNNGTVKSGSSLYKPAYAKDPADIINYVSKHDNETLWDQLQYDLPSDMSLANRVRAQHIAATIPLLSQGIPFFQFGGDLLRSKSLDRNSYDSGDWFNYVDFTKNTNNWNVGLPLAQDNEGKWSKMSGLIANPETAVMSSKIEYASAVFNEVMAIRQASKLFRLTTANDVFERVGFHNTGSGQTQGLIVMSIDDGVGVSDLDPAVNAIVVVINGTDTQQSHEVLTANAFELHSILQSSTDPIVQTASFVANSDSGTFVVPAYTTAVFVKPQGSAQGAGLAANVTADAPDVAPYGTTTVYLRGSINNWGNDGLTVADSFSYDGADSYSISIDLAVGTHNFKVASQDWAAVNLGFSDVNLGADSISLAADSDGNFELVITTAGTYRFSLDASTTTPMLSVVNFEPTLACDALSDSAAAYPFSVSGGGQLYVRGDHSGWDANEQYRLHYKGNNQYQAVANFDGEFQFKLASDDGSWSTQLWAQTPGSTDINTSNLTVGISNDVAYQDAGTENNHANLPAGQYSFLLTLNEANPSSGTNIGTLLIQKCL